MRKSPPPSTRMFVELKEVLRLLMLMTKQNKTQGPENKGGLLVLIWTEASPDVQSLYCTVAAAGPWCAGIQMEELHPVFADVMERLHPCPGLCPEPDIEDLCAFTDVHGSLSVFLSFLMKNIHISRPKWQHEIETFFHTFSITNAEIKIYLKLRGDQKLYQREFGVNDYLRVPLSDQTLLYFDTVNTHSENSSIAHLESSKSGQRCHGRHPEIGDSLLLSIPPKAIEQGLFGTVTLQLVTLLRPCVQQYPNMTTNLTQIKVLVYCPSNVPVTNPSAFVQNFPSYLNCPELGLQNDRLSLQEVIPSGGTVYKVEQVNSLECGGKSSLLIIDQSLLLLLFLKHTDPFTTEISDIMATEVLLEHHLEDILLYNKQAVTNAMANELKKTMTAQNNRKKDQERMQSACEVILSSTLSIISCSSNMDFRKACLNTMKVHNNQQMSVAISESLRRVIFWKFAPSRKFDKCCQNQMGQQPKKNKHTRVEM